MASLPDVQRSRPSDVQGLSRQAAGPFQSLGRLTGCLPTVQPSKGQNRKPSELPTVRPSDAR
jgi:hypothetical protein